MRAFSAIRKIRADLISLAVVVGVTSTLGNLLFIISPTSAASLSQVTPTKIATLKNCSLVQGGATDGKYIYSACVNGDSHTSTQIVKSDLNGSEVSRSKSYSRSEVGHANAMTYNSKTGKLLLTAWDDDSSGNNGIKDKVRIIDPSNLNKIESTVTFNKGEVPNICYSASMDQYVSNGRLFDSNYQYIRTLYSSSDSKLNADSQMTGATAGQGISCDSSHIYVIRWSKSQSITRIIAYDWAGNVGGVYDLKGMKDEVENLFIVGGTIYAGVNSFSTTSYIIKLSSATSDIALTVGTYNILGYYHGDGSKYNPARLQQIVSNINTMQYDVVGLQEYRDQKAGDPKALEHQLQTLNPAFKMSYVDPVGGGYDTGQLNIVYNTNTVRLVEDRVIKAYDPNNRCGGGSGSVAVRAAKFVIIATNQEFLVLNVHPTAFHSSSKCDDERLGVIKGALADSVVGSYSGPLFLVGDFNANPTGSRRDEGNIERYLKSVGFANSRDIQNANRASGGGVIDHVYYKTSSVAAPTSYESMDCKAIPEGDPNKYNATTTCASDHHPVKAVFFGEASSCSTASTLSDAQRAQFKEWSITYYDPTINACCTTPIVPASGLTGDTDAEKAFNFFISTPVKSNNNQPLNAAQAAGIVGSLIIETGGREPSPKKDIYDLNPEAHNDIKGGHTGIAQWDQNRFAKLKSFASSKNGSWQDLQIQLQFIVEEIETTHSAVVKDSQFKNAPNTAAGADTAARRWNKFYEIGGGDDARAHYATMAYADFSSNIEGSAAASTAEQNTSDATTLSSTASSGCTTSVASGEYVFPLKASKKDVRSWGNNPGTTEWTSGRYHEKVFNGYYAVDLMAPEGTEILAFHAGKVIQVDTGSYGETFVEILDSEGYTYFYTHMSTSRGAQVKKGDTVAAGKLIGYVGNKHEGWDTVTHLHIDKSKNPGNGFRGTCSASAGYCPIASEHRFVKIVTELHDSYESLNETGTSSL